MSESFRRYLRALPDFPENLPDFDPAAAPANPAELFRDWRARPAADGSHNPDWQLYAIQPQEIEFWQARHDRRHVRHHYGPDPAHSLR